MKKMVVLNHFGTGIDDGGERHETNGNTGPSTKVMRKAKMSFQSGQVKQVIRTYAVEIQTSDKKELEASAVEMKLRKAMGANCKIVVAFPCQMLTDVKTTDRSRPTKRAQQQLIRQQIDHSVDSGGACLLSGKRALPIKTHESSRRYHTNIFSNHTTHFRQVLRLLLTQNILWKRAISGLP
jgi:hypothetical protein